MMHAPLSWLRRHAHLLRLLVLAAALACQVRAGVPLPEGGTADVQAALLATASTFCQSGTHKAGDHTPSPHRPVPGQAVCGAFSAHVHAAALLNLEFFVPAPIAGQIGRATLFAARAPPTRDTAWSFARGPPGLV